MTAKRILGLLAAALCGVSLPAVAAPATSELECGDKRLEIHSYCEKPEAGIFPECTRQEIVFGPGPKPKRLIFSPHGRDKVLVFVAADWACVKGNDAHYLLVRFWSGGNCTRCEPMEIIDLSGRRLTSTRREFERLYRRKGLPKRFPDLIDIDDGVSRRTVPR